MYTIDSLTIQYDDHLILDRQSFSLPDTGLIGITGPSGCGKTSLLYVLSGLMKPGHGQVVFNGQVITTALMRQNVAFVKQNSDLLPSLNVKDNITIGCELSSIRFHQHDLKVIVRRLGIEHLLSRMPSELSKGQQKRVTIARALLKKASVILCDEPTGALHQRMANEIMAMLSDLSHEALVIIVSHDQTLLAHYTDQIIHFNNTHLEVPVWLESHSVDHSPAHHRYSLLTYTIKAIWYDRKRYMTLCLFQWVVLSAFLIMLSSLNSFQQALDHAYEHAVDKNIITIEDKQGNELHLEGTDAYPHFLFEYGQILNKKAGHPIMAQLPRDTSHIRLSSGRWPRKAKEIVITAAMDETLNHPETIRYQLDDSLTLKVTGVIEDDIYHKEAIYFSALFASLYPQYQSQYIYELESKDVQKDLDKWNQSCNATNDELMSLESWQGMLSLGRLLAIIYLMIALISALMLMSIILSSIAIKRQKSQALMRAMGLTLKALRFQQLKESCVLGMILCIGTLAVDYFALVLINDVSPWYTHFHFYLSLTLPKEAIGVLIGLVMLLCFLNQKSVGQLTDQKVIQLLRSED